MNKNTSKILLNINEQIRAAEVRLIDENKKDIGILTIEQALDRAESSELDLVEILPDQDPPLCKIMDFELYKRNLRKKMQTVRRKATTSHLKEIRLGIHIAANDLNTKIQHIKKFLSNGDRVRLRLRFRGREHAQVDKGFTIMNNTLKAVEEVSKIDTPPEMKSGQIIALIHPKNKV